MPATRPAKRQKRNAVEAIDHAGAEPVRAPTLLSPASGRGECCKGLCLSALLPLRLAAVFRAPWPAALRWQPQESTARCNHVSWLGGLVASAASQNGAGSGRRYGHRHEQGMEDALGEAKAAF